LAIVLSLAALLIRALIPPGMMPASVSSPDGGFTIAICASGGLKIVSADPSGGTPHAPGEQHEDCPFGALGQAAAIADVPLAAASRIKPAFDAPGYRGAIVPLLLRSGAARAPPSIS
jgi:hypothetical protein